MMKYIVDQKIIYPNSMYNREDLSKMSKDELINMLMLKKKPRLSNGQDRFRLRAPKRQDQSSSPNHLHN